jgi:hypothetical protein
MVVPANSEGCKTSKVDAGPGKGKLSFKGKVSSFFFPSSKRLAKEKTILPSDISDEKVEASFLGGTQSETEHGLEFDEQVAFCKDKADNSTLQTSCSSRVSTCFKLYFNASLFVCVRLHFSPCNVSVSL